MPLPFLLSPFLRVFHREGRPFLDNGLSYEELDPAEDAVVRALWPPRRAEMELVRVHAQLGPRFQPAIASLLAKSILFRDAREQDGFLMQALHAHEGELPVVDCVELTNTCPMRCRFCARGVPGQLKRPEGHMALPLFERILDQLPERQSRHRNIELSHQGESLLHPELPRFVEAAERRGLGTELTFTASLLTPDLARRLVDAGLRKFIASVDGMDDATFTAARGPLALYSKAEEGLDALLCTLDEAGSGAEVVIQMLALDKNKEQRARFLDRWGRLGRPRVEAFVRGLDGIDEDVGTTTSEPWEFLCSFPFRAVTVLWDGRVVPCFKDSDAAAVIGDLSRQSLAEVWRSDEARALRDWHVYGDFPPGHLCAECNWQCHRFAGRMDRRNPDLVQRDPGLWSPRA